MALTQRLLQVALTFPNGDVVIIDQTLNLRVSIEKNLLATQNKCDIEISNLNSDRRGQLMTQFSAWRNNQVSQGQLSYQGLVQVRVQAGYNFTGAPPITTVFVGEVALCDITQVPPNVTLRLTCYTRQCDQSKWVSTPPNSNLTYQQYAQWVVDQMNNFLLPGQNQVTLDFQSVNANKQANNFGLPFQVSALMYDLQNYWMPDVAVWVDDEIVYVRDKGNAIQQGQLNTIDAFVGIPAWNEWGVEGQCLFLPSLKLCTAIQLQSSMNPTVNNGQYVIAGLNYTLASRDDPFYVKFRAFPPASQ